MTYIALLRGINVGGHAILPMKQLVSIFEKTRMKEVRTYIQSGNVIFESSLGESAAISRLEKALKSATGKDIAVVIRTASEIAQVLKKNPFPKGIPSQVGVYFFAAPIAKDFMQGVVADVEEVVVAKREVYIHFPNGMGRTKIKLPAEAKSATVRNINTLGKLVELVGA